MARTKQSAIEKAKKEAAAERRRRREEASSRREGEQVDYRDEMMEAIVSVERAPGDFACQGSTPGLIMGLEVDGLGKVPLPLLDVQAQALARLCEQAPFGRGDKTVIDTSVRNTWQLAPSKFRVTNPGWDAALSRIVDQVRGAFGLPDERPVDARLYKLLLYGPGCFFAPHRDTEKAAGMFATLSVMLPSEYSGGELLVSHGGETRSIDVAADNAFNICYSAFYTDCTHEVKPVASGYRLCLVYNLCHTAEGPAPTPAYNSAAVARLLGALAAWEKEGRAAPHKLLYMLEHRYSASGIAGGLLSLKGADRGAGTLLLQAATRAGAHVFLATVSREQHCEGEGSSVVTDDAAECYDEVTHVVPMSAGAPAGFDLPLGFKADEEMVQGEEIFRQVGAARENWGAPTGNEGCEVTRWYKLGAVMIVPKSRFCDFLASSSIPAAMALLKQRCADARRAKAAAAAGKQLAAARSKAGAAAGSSSDRSSRKKRGGSGGGGGGGGGAEGTEDGVEDQAAAALAAQCEEIVVALADVVVKTNKFGEAELQQLLSEVDALGDGVLYGKVLEALVRRRLQHDGCDMGALFAVVREAAGRYGWEAVRLALLAAVSRAARGGFRLLQLLEPEATAAAAPRELTRLFDDLVQRALHTCTAGPIGSSAWGCSSAPRTSLQDAVDFLALLVRRGDTGDVTRFMAGSDVTLHGPAIAAELWRACGRLGWPPELAAPCQAAVAAAVQSTPCNRDTRLRWSVLQNLHRDATAAGAPRELTAMLPAVAAAVFAETSEYHLSAYVSLKDLQGVLDVLVHLGDAQLVGALAAARDVYLQAPQALPALLDAWKKLDWAPAVAGGLKRLLDRITDDGRYNVKTCYGIMAAAAEQCDEAPPVAWAALTHAFGAMASMLVSFEVNDVKDKERRDPPYHYSYYGDEDSQQQQQQQPPQPYRVDAADVVNLFQALEAVRATSHLDAAARSMAAKTKAYDVCRVLVPALSQLHAKWGAARAARCDAFCSLLRHCHQDVRQADGASPAPPRDWAQPIAVRLDCRCKHCRGASEFLASATQTDYRIKGPQAWHDHLRRMLQAVNADVSFEREGHSAPYTLRVHKERTQYAAALKRHRKQAAALQELKRMARGALGGKLGDDAGSAAPGGATASGRATAAAAAVGRGSSRASTSAEASGAPAAATAGASAAAAVQPRAKRQRVAR